MIRVTKPKTAPKHLRDKGSTTAQRHCGDFDAAPADYSSGKKTFAIDRDIYAGKAVKNALLKAQHEKCAFCESSVVHIAYGDVEHYRPKAGYQQAKGDPLGRPGYYWLAYSWDNLFFVCQICNQRHKGNLFPLRDPARRALNHGHSVDDEQPLLIHPEKDDPEEFITFHAEMAVAKNGSDRGLATIEVTGLNREALAERRRERLATAKILKMVAELGIPESDDAKRHLAGMQTDDAEHASMVRCLFKSP